MSEPNFILTKHAKERMQDRGITQDMVRLALKKPDQTLPGDDPSKVKFIRTIDRRRTQVVATLLPSKQWLVISVWVRGEDDRVPFVWLILSAPFKLGWWLIKTVGKWLWNLL